MALLLFPLVAYLAAMAYLVGWLISQSLTTYQRVRDWARQRRMVLSSKAWDRVGENKDLLLSLAGAFSGGVIAVWLVQVFIREWLLVAFVVLAVLSEEMRISSKEMQLLDVMVFFNHLDIHAEENQDLFEALAKVIQELPEGSVQKAAREAVLRRRRGDSIEENLKAMRGIDPFLDEFVLTLQLSGWQKGQGLNVILNRLSVRVGRKWDRVSRELLIKDNYHACVLICHGALVAGLWVILISSSSALQLVMPDLAVILLAALAILGLGLIFYLFLTRQWLRRFLVVSIFVLTLVGRSNSLIVPLPSWIQVETISHHSNSVGVKDRAPTQIGMIFQGLPAYFIPASSNKPPVSKIPISTLTPTPKVATIVILTPPVSISTMVITQEINPCCLRPRQPR